MTKRISELEDKLAKTKLDSTERVDILHELARELGRDDLESAKQYAAEADRLAHKLQYQRGIIYARLNRGMLHFFGSEIERSRSYLIEALDWFEENGDKRGQADAKTFLGLIYWSFGDFERGFELTTSALRLNEERQDAARQPWNLNTLGGYHYDSGDYQQSLKYFQKAYKLFKGNQDKGGEARALNGIGNNYHKLGKHDQALTYQNKSLKILQSHENNLVKSKVLNDIGQICQSRGKPGRAFEHFKRSLRIRQEIGYATGETTTLLNLGRLFIEEKETDKALEMISEALRLSEEIKAKPKISRAHLSLAEIYEGLGQFEKALEHHRQFHKTEKDVYQADANKRLQHMKVLYQLERERAENIRKTQELEEARKLQMSMVPQEMPSLPNLEIAANMKTATEVGGDYYDFYVADDGTLTVAIGDATGHGSKAGIMVTAIKALFTSLGEDKDIIEFFHETSRSLNRIKLGNLYMGLTLARIKDNTLVASAAGMPPILMYRAGKNRIEEIVLKGMPLGSYIKFPFPYQQQTVQLAPGDTLLFMTDGLEELLNQEGETLDYSRVREHFEEVAGRPGQEIVNHLFDTAANWRASRPQNDDITFVVVKVVGT